MGQTSHHTPSAARCGWVIRGAGEAVALGVVGLMLASVVVLWISNGGWDQLLVSPIAFFYSASRLLGLLSSVLVLLQVEIECVRGKLATARAVVYPEPNRRSERINKLAVPMLDRSATQSQGAKVNAVSGATFTAVAYEKSLQSALDAAAIEEAQTAK